MKKADKARKQVRAPAKATAGKTREAALKAFAQIKASRESARGVAD